MLKQVIFVLFVAVCTMHSASAIKCYQCKSLTDPNCAKDKIDSASNIRAVDCDSVPKPNTMEQLQPVTRCNKVVTSDRAGTIVSRDCHFESIGQKDNECTVTHSRQVESCYTCKGDLCNASGAGRFLAVSATALLAILPPIALEPVMPLQIPPYVRRALNKCKNTTIALYKGEMLMLTIILIKIK
ncbi:GD22125 [Drosophila simulans]|uniref:GD22125 n=1 Tax=Drosophila simulans TaxID=7240 RepID=B4Q3R8_DROSI|nr:GD22125 [Drosophila simulans]